MCLNMGKSDRYSVLNLKFMIYNLKAQKSCYFFFFSFFVDKEIRNEKM